MMPALAFHLLKTDRPHPMPAPPPKPSATTRIRVAGDAVIAVPDSLGMTTPYVLREQEDWFEADIRFVRKLVRPGWRALDIGANYGLYTVALARGAGDGGRVWAYEPASATAALLRETIALNGLNGVEVIQAGLSAREGTAELHLGPDATLSTFAGGAGSGGSVESVPITTLDRAAERHGWERLDFVKLDAEGEEVNILEGGRDALSALSPLVMFEFKHGPDVNRPLLAAFADLGYGLWQLYPGLGVLVPFDPGAPFDPRLLNLYACKTDRARALAEQGLLAASGEPSMPERVDGGLWEAHLGALPYAAGRLSAWKERLARGGGEERALHQALCWYALAHDTKHPPGHRAEALTRALLTLLELNQQRPTPARTMTLARVFAEAGRAAYACHFLGPLADALERETSDGREPLLPPRPRFDRVPPGDAWAAWFETAALEGLERRSSYSSFFVQSDPLPRLERLRALPFRAPEMERRRQLVRMRRGLQSVPEPHDLLVKAGPDNLNPEYWSRTA